MGRISLCEDHAVPDEVREIYEVYRKERGNVPNAFKTFAHRPHYLRTMIAHYRAVMFEGELDFPLKELLLVKVSQLNTCRY